MSTQRTQVHRVLVRRFLFGLAVLGLLVAGPAGAATSNESVARSYFDDVHTNGDFDLASSLIAADAVFHTPDGELRGPEGVVALLTGVRTSFPDARFLIHDMNVNGDIVVVRWTLVGTHLGAFGNLRATGASVSMEGICILRFEDGMIVEEWAQYDRLALRQQIETAIAEQQDLAGLIDSPADQQPVDRPGRFPQ